MEYGFDSEFDEEFAEGASRAFFVSAWADYQEEQGERLDPTVDLVD